VAFDCHVTAICSSKNADFVKKLGADAVIDYTSENVPQTLLSQSATQKYDLLVDCVGGTELLSHYVHTSPF
jgi:reticulon-4-interacting protein 1, mitochondrial